MILYKSPARAVAAPLCPTTFLSPFASSFSLSFSSSSLLRPSFSSLHRIHAYIYIYIYLLASSSLSVLIFAIRPVLARFSTRSRALRALRRSFEARDRRSYWWQRDSFVLSRRFQLIFIVYLPDQRYLEDNGPPRYIRSEPYHVNTEVYLLSLPTSGRRSRSSHRTRV